MPRAHLFALALTLLFLAACGPAGPRAADPPDTNGPDPNGPGEVVDVRLELVADGFAQPLGVTHAGDGSGRLFVVERGGTVRVVVGDAVSDTPYLDVSALLPPPEGENGLLGLAFHPAFADDGRLYAHFTDAERRNVVAEFVAEGPGAPSVDAATLTPLLTATPDTAIHQGGDLAFGPDGFLYVALGDGGTPDTARDPGTLHGSILRIDVDADDAPSAIPDDNPFVGDPQARPEVWAYGLRNPWRFSFDAATGDMWIADVGQNAVEEINMERFGDAGGRDAGGRDYGWPIMEGDRCFRPPEGCDTTGLTLPVITYDHADGWGRAVIGGSVYRGEAIPGLEGAYVFGDYVSGGLFVARETADGWRAEPLLETDLAVVSFGVDEAGELHVVDFAGGGLYRLVPAHP
jgi:glucose/arabinose dehydrogenase